MTTLVTPAASGMGPGAGPGPDQGWPPSLRPGMLPGTVPPDVRVPEGRKGWWRRNAVWLVLLPVAIAVAAGASSFRVWAFWWPVGLHHEVERVAVGEQAHLAGEYYDLGLDVPERANTTVLREIDATVTSIQQVDRLPAPSWGDPVTIPDGSVAYEVGMHFAAEPKTDLSGCQIVLVADDGTRYGESTTDVLGSSNRCSTPDAAGFVSERPEWDVTSFVLADPAAEITQVRLGFGGPEYLTFDVP
jgi:hypothetical protein